MLENKFKQNLKKKIKALFKGSIVIHLDPTDIQGIPDLLILYNGKAALLEGKACASASFQPNQQYYIQEFLKQGFFASVIYPENEKEVLDELNTYFKN